MPSSLDLQLFEAMPGNSALLLPNAPHFTIIAVTEGYVQTSEKPKAELVGKGLFEAFPNSPDDSTGGIVLRAILGKVLETKCPQNLPVHRYDIFTAAGAFDERYWSAVNKPVLNENGEILYIIHTAVDLTLQVRTEQNQKVFNELEKRYKEILAAPVLMCILKGDDYRLAMTNAQTLSVWGRSGDVVGKPIIEVLPELAGQEILDMLDMVRKRGELLKTYETSVTLLHNGTEDVRYFDFVFQPFYEPDNATVATGVVVVAHDQTKQVVAKKKAAESEEKFRSLIEHSPVAMHIVRGPDFVFEIINKKMLGLMGKKKEEVAGRRMMDVFPEIIYQDFGRMLQQSYATGERFEANEYPVVIMRDGAEVQLFLNFVYEPIREKDGLLPGIVVVAVDVTEQVTARRKVEVSVQEVHAIIDSAPFPIGVYTGKEMRIRFANQSIIDVWGKGPEVIGKTYAEVLPELEGSGIYGQLHAVYSTGVPYHARNQQVNLVVNGVLQPFFFNYSFTPLYDIGGKIYGVMNTAAEITDLHLAKLQVEQSERNFRSMIVQAPVAMCILLGPEHVVDVANEAMFALWGKPVEQVMNKPIFEALPDARNQGLEKVMNAVYETGIPFYANERPVNLLRNGRMETVYQNFVYQPYNDADGKILGVIAISVDVTNQVMARQKIEQIVTQRTGELAEANAALVKGNLELMRLNANLEEFAYAASHDLKEPIRKIHFFSDRLKSELAATLSTEQKLLFDRLENASRRMGSLIDDLLAYSQAGRGLGEEEEVDLAKKVQLVLGDLELEVQQKGARVIVESLPTLRGSKRQIQQLLHNLLSNALKYSKAGTTPEIRISSALVMGGSVKPDLPKELAENTFHLVDVKDNGIGFSQEDAGRIFNVFTRLHGNAEYRGTGVGLSIAQKVVQNHGGFIWAESSEGEGATFRILLPAE